MSKASDKAATATSLAAAPALCRGCLAAGCELQNMFDSHLDKHFYTITNVKLDRRESLSVMLCSQCERALLECRRFRFRCQKSDATLRQMTVPTATQTSKPSTSPADSTGNEAGDYKESTVTAVFTGHKLTLLITPRDLDSDREGTLLCPYNCANVFAKRNNLISHLAKNHGVDESKFVLETQYYCKYKNCPYEMDSGKNKHFSVRKTLNKHISNMHASKRTVCDVCNESFTQESAFERHKAVCDTRFLCLICNIEYKTNERLLVHLLRKHPDLHKQYKRQRKELKQQARVDNKRTAEEIINAKRIKSDIENQSTQTIVKEKTNIETQMKKPENAFDPIKRTLATQTFQLKSIECVKNDISLNSCVAHSPQPLKHSVPQQTDESSQSDLNDVFPCTTSSTIETQTVFEDILSIRSQTSEDEIFETVSLSDIHTQTWPLEFEGKTKNTSETQTNPLTKRTLNDSRGMTASPDLSFKETQTCFCFLDSPKPSTSHFNFPKYLFDSATSSPTNCNLTSTETQTAEMEGFSIRPTDVLLSFNSIETQTCDESSSDGTKLNI